MASQQGLRRRSSVAEKRPAEPVEAISTVAMAGDACNGADAASPSTSIVQAAPECALGDQALSDDTNAHSMPPPPRPVSQEFSTPTRESRSASASSRHMNRLSLTIPIALPTPEPSRPKPKSAMRRPSIPLTPLENLTADTPLNANEFIIAIAAQERRVLELREELARAEGDLSSLKRQLHSQEGYHKRKEGHMPVSTQASGQAADDGMKANRLSLDADRRKQLLLQGQASPAPGRRVLRGGHTRTLSLLSPAKSDTTFSVLDEAKDVVAIKPLERRATEAAAVALSRRTSWQPRLIQDAAGMGLVQDFKSGLRAFVEDIRQITVGDEPIKGHVPPADAPAGGSNARDLDTVRAQASATRAKAGSTSDSPASSAPTPLSRSSTGATKHKPFSWTPLGFDSMGDNDWTHWELPASVKSVRWSGSTVSNGETEDISENADEGPTTPLKNARSKGMDLPLLSPRLEELLPSVVNKLSPSNLKRTATNLMDEWEKSLGAPNSANKENTT